MKAVAEIPLDGVPTAIGNAEMETCRVEVNDIPPTPENVLVLRDWNPEAVHLV